MASGAPDQVRPGVGGGVAAEHAEHHFAVVSQRDWAGLPCGSRLCSPESRLCLHQVQRRRGAWQMSA